jgi:hypothetical protein
MYTHGMYVVRKGALNTYLTYACFARVDIRIPYTLSTDIIHVLKFTRYVGLCMQYIYDYSKY